MAVAQVGGCDEVQVLQVMLLFDAVAVNPFITSFGDKQILELEGNIVLFFV